MKKYLYFLLLLAGTAAFSQDVKLPENTIYTTVEVRPEFPGGLPLFYKYISENYRVPAAFNGVGKVIGQFTIEKDGSVTDIKIIRDLGFGTGDELMRVLKDSPKWTPGMQDGRPVRVLYTLPLSLQQPKKRYSFDK